MKNEKGFSLIEVLVALALLGIIAAAFLGGIATASKAALIADKRTNAESLARTQMEYVREQAYSIAPWDYTVTSSQRSSTDQPSWWNNDNPPLFSNNYDGYTANVIAELLHDTDDGIQQITVTVSHGGEAVITLKSYRSVR